MGLKAKFTPAQVEAMIQQRTKRIEVAIVRRLKYLGEKCLIECRSNHTYTDRTGNLTNSMGYIILADGANVDTDGFDSGEGGAAGKQVAESAASKYPSGFVLIVVAGMNYAAYVESKGYNVLTSAEQLAQEQLPKMLSSLKSNIDKMN